MHNNGIVARLLSRIVEMEPREVRALLWSFAYFFLLLCSYYILRPLRDEMGIAGGIKNLPWVFTGTFLAMLVAVPLFGWVAGRYARGRLLPIVYYFFIANILIFFAAFHVLENDAVTARSFFIWTSVFNLFVVSVFWSFMADVFSNAQARRLFGFIAAGGSAGAIVGPAITVVAAPLLGPINLLPVSAALLGVAVVCIHRLNRLAPELSPGRGEASPRPIGGGVLDGIVLVLKSPYLLGVCLFILLYTTLSTFLYFEQAHIVKTAFDDSKDRTSVFAIIDLAVNTLTVLLQVLATGRLIAWLGMPRVLALMPVLVAIGFFALGYAPILAVLVVFQVLRRAGNYGITRPAREVLFTVVGRDAKYKAKNFIDTVVFRGGDAVAGWIFAGLTALGMGLAQIAWLGVPIAGVWAAVGYWLGRRQERMRGESERALGTAARVPPPA